MKPPLGDWILPSAFIYGIFLLKQAAGVAQLRAGRRQPPLNAWKLYPESGNSLKILQITDVHLGEDPRGTWGPEQDSKSLQGISSLLDFEKPRLAVLSGDEVASGNLGSIGELKGYWDLLVKPLEDSGIHWCTVLGNHDSCGVRNCSHRVMNSSSMTNIVELAQMSGVADPPATDAGAAHDDDVAEREAAQARSEHVAKQVGNIFQGPKDTDEAEIPTVAPVTHSPPVSDDVPPHVPGPMKESSIRKELLNYDRSFALSRTGGDSNLFLSRSGSLSNYWLPVYPSKAAAESNSPAAILWFLDSGGGDTPEQIGGDQVAWIRYEKSEIERHHGVLPGILFMHMPPDDYIRMREQGQTCKGVSDDFVTPPEHGTPSDLFPAAAGAGVKWVFVGHNHGNDWCCRAPVTDDVGNSHDVSFCYGRHSGFGGYTTPDVLEPGARAIEMRFVEEGPVKIVDVSTWVRQVDGQVLSQTR